MDGSESHGHKQVNDRQHKAFQMSEDDRGNTPGFHSLKHF